MRLNLAGLAANKMKYWWGSLLTGIFSIILGVLCLTIPDITLAAMTYIFAGLLFLNAVSDMVFAVSNRRVLYGWGWSLTGGIAEILFAVLLLVLPHHFLASLLVVIVGIWMLLRAVWSFWRLRELSGMDMKNRGWALAGGIVTLLFALFFLLSPSAFKGILVTTLIAIALFVYGVGRIVQAFDKSRFL